MPRSLAMTTPPTRVYELIEARLGSDLAEHVAKMRAEKVSWHKISIDLAERTNVVVTPQTISNWFAETVGAA
jgi:hypothetical protein